MPHLRWVFTCDHCRRSILASEVDSMTIRNNIVCRLIVEHESGAHRPDDCGVDAVFGHAPKQVIRRQFEMITRYRA